ncbi:MAG: molybdopterin molybdenumtransferase MoeA, partial [Oscillibacter sp.]|nr:molybdopterin molybdenumtransferase MoeA [Oscillibacter sp.]
LAGAGVERVTVCPAPRVAILSTGSELQRAGAPLARGKIYDANAAYLTARLRELGVGTADAAQVGDDPAALEAAFADAARTHDLVISTGGVSVGQADLVVETLRRLGATEHFHGVAVKPGMPAAFFTLGGTPVSALSGNPFACAVTFELLTRVCLARLASNEALAPRAETARLEAAYAKPRPVRRFFGGVLHGGFVTVPDAQENGKTRMLAHADCLAELPCGDEPIPARAEVTVYRL